MNNTSFQHFFNSTRKQHTAAMPNRLFFQNLQRYVYGYTMMAICSAGILGNILAFAVLSRKSMRSSNTATYLRCLAAVDACVLLLAILRYQSYYVLLTETQVIEMVLNFYPYVQVYITPLFWVTLGVSSFITLSLSFERYLAIRWPFTLKQRCTKTMVQVCIVVIIIVVLLVTFPHFLCYNVKKAKFGNITVAVIQLTNAYLDAHAYLHAYNYYILPIMWYMLPWVMVTVFNILLSIQVQKTSRIRVGIPTLVNLNRNLSILIILIVGIYMICHFPRCILAFYCLVNYCSATGMGEDINTKSYYIVIAVADTLNILNSCLNIVVYCLTGSRFRHEVKRLLLCRSFCTPPVIQPTIQSVHVSLREVPATPMDDRKSFNMSYKELQLPNSSQPSPSQSEVDLQSANTKTSSNMTLSKDSTKMSANTTLNIQGNTSMPANSTPKESQRAIQSSLVVSDPQKPKRNFLSVTEQKVSIKPIINEPESSYLDHDQWSSDNENKTSLMKTDGILQTDPFSSDLILQLNPVRPTAPSAQQSGGQCGDEWEKPFLLQLPPPGHMKTDRQCAMSGPSVNTSSPFSVAMKSADSQSVKPAPSTFLQTMSTEYQS